MKYRRRGSFVTSAEFPPGVFDEVHNMFTSAITALAYILNNDTRWAEFARVTTPAETTAAEVDCLHAAMAADLARVRRYRLRLDGLISEIAAWRGEIERRNRT